MVRCFDAGKIARTEERTLIAASLLSTPHPSPSPLTWGVSGQEGWVEFLGDGFRRVDRPEWPVRGVEIHACRAPETRAGVKVRAATRESGLDLDAEHGSGKRNLRPALPIGSEPDRGAARTDEREAGAPGLFAAAGGSEGLRIAVT
jgi:hypothetical protein